MKTTVMAATVCVIVSGGGCGDPPATAPAPASPASPAAGLSPAPVASSAGTPVAEPAGKTSKQAEFESDSLTRLRALQVFTVPQLIAGQPDETFSCYGPCSRLGKLVVMAETEAKKPAPNGSCEQAVIAANLAAIEALKIVHVDGLVKGERADTCARAGKLANIAAGAKTLQ